MIQLESALDLKDSHRKKKRGIRRPGRAIKVSLGEG